MPSAEPQDAASAVGKTSLATPPAPATGERGRLKAAERSGRGGELQPVACGIDPGSTREGVAVKSGTHTDLTIDADAVTHVREAVDVRRQMRKARRFRTTPCRPPRAHRARGGIPPSTRARWQWTLRGVDWLRRLHPFSTFVVEDIAAETRGQRRWDASFSPLEVGKRWFDDELRLRGDVVPRAGWETHALRTELGLPKSRRASKETFWAHCADSWTLAASAVGGPSPDVAAVLRLSPVRLHRRQLHRREPARGGVRRPYGGTRSPGFKRGALVLHPRFGLAYVGGATDGRTSLHDLAAGSRLTQRARPAECIALARNTWRVRLLPGLTSGVSGAGVSL